MAGFALRASCARILAPQSAPQRRSRHGRGAGSVQVMASDAFCRDVVGVRKDVQSQGKVYTIKFLGSGGEVRQVACPDDTYILDAAEKQGLDLPATCRGGICGACVARVSKGTIDSSDIPDLSFTLDEEEQAQGMALLCMSRPTSDLEVETQCDWGYSLGVGEWQGASGRFEASPDPLMGEQWSAAKAASSATTS